MLFSPKRFSAAPRTCIRRFSSSMAFAPESHRWATLLDELNRLMQVRGAALKRFGENNIREGAPLATLEDVLVQLYMLHRYQVEAASKLVGGMEDRKSVV